MNCDSFQRMRTGVQRTGFVIDRLKHSTRRWNSLRQRFQRRMQRDPGTVWILHLRQRLRDEYGEISLGRLAWLEASRGLRLTFDPIDAKGSPVLSSDVPRNQIPAIAGVYKAVRLDDPRARCPGAIVILKANTLMIAACSRDGRQKFRIHRWTTSLQRHDERIQSSHSVTQSRRQHLFQLHQRPD